MFGLDQIVGHHLGAHFLRVDLWHPAEFLFGFGGVTQQGFDFCGAEVAGVDADNRNFVDYRVVCDSSQ